MADKKVTIITIYDPNPNYGNRLQNYAVQTVSTNLGLNATTLSFQRSTLSIQNKIKYSIHSLTKYSSARHKDYWKAVFPRAISFDKFNNKYIKTKQITKIEEIEETDYFIIGSDQVWNPKWYRDCDLKKNMYLLTFARPEQKVCFSPSFSVDTLPDNWIPWFKKHLNSFPQFSVREEAGAKIIKELTGKDAEVLIDPTLMLDKEEWLQIASCPRGVDCHKPYILTYFIGERSDKVNNHLKEYSKLLDAEVYNLFDSSQPKISKSDPSEFIYLISKATLVLTDSFHACVFSFIFNKPFLLYDRTDTNNMMSRMDTLFEKFDLKRKYVNSGLNNELLEHDYQQGYEVLQEERKKVINFLKRSMHLD